jgi:predicted ester cyclase
MGIEQNKALYRQYIQEVFNEGRLDRLDELLSPSYVYRNAPPGTPPGAEAIRQVVTMFRTGFPDLHITIDDQVAEGDLVCTRATTRGTHNGTIFGIAPTGNVVTMTGFTQVRIVDGRVAESWVTNDVMGLMNQLHAGPQRNEQASSIA